jgi:hypothetical protein
MAALILAVIFLPARIIGSPLFFPIVPVLGGNISDDRRGKIQGHVFTFSFAMTSAWR